MRLENKLARRFPETLRLCPHAGSGVHSWLMSCANLAAITGIPPMEAEAEITRAMTRPPSPSSEVASAIHKAYAEIVPGGLGTDYKPRYIASAKPKPLPMTAQAFIRKGDGAEESDWWAASPVRIDWEPGPRDALTVLDALYAPDDCLFCGERYGVEVLTVREWRARIANGGPVPPHIIPNTLTGREHPLADGKLSRRGDSAVCGFKYAVAEFDTMSKAEQLALWWGFRSAPIVALIDSGGKSIHAWLKVDSPDRAVWERDVEQKLFARILCPLGCDPQCRNESRLSRLPGHFRREKNQWQRLLYLNPEGSRR